MKTQRKHPRGGAAVETAVLMIVLVPLVMYALFLEDLLYYHFDQEEAVVSTPWDMASYDYRHPPSEIGSMTWTAQHFARLTYADHSSASNSYSNPNIDTNDEGHHQALAAHQCWLAMGGKQVTLNLDSSMANLNAYDFQSVAGGPSGGLVTASAVLGVQNYFLPQNFMQDYWGTQNKMTEQQRWSDRNIHDNAHHDGYTFPEDRVALLHDSYALNYIRSAGGVKDSTAEHLELDSTEGDNEFGAWVDGPYSQYSSNLDQAKQFASEADDKEILDESQVTRDGMGDDVSTLPISWSAEPSQRFSDDMAPSGMADQRVEATSGSMQSGYMGRSEYSW